MQRASSFLVQFVRLRSSCVAAGMLSCLLAGPGHAQQPPPQDPDPAKKFFASAPVIRVAITLDPAERQTLRDKPREYVPATMHLDGDKQGWAKVGVKLKGAAGSFREIDDRPGFTINLAKFGGKERLHGLKRFHLNNGVQDDSRLREWLGSEIFAAAGYPAPRVAHALVTLDGENLGMYVLREAFDSQFLQRTIGKQNGCLYDGGFCQDIDCDLEKDSGDGPDDHSDLVRLRDACAKIDPQHITKLASALDVDAFIDFMALEALVAHWDGYCQNRNNFRLWCSTELGQSRFLPHGMDQVFDRTDDSVLKHPAGIVASAVQQHPEWRKRYRERLQALLPLMKSSVLNKQLKARAAKLQREWQRQDDQAARGLDDAVRNLMGNVEARFRHLQKEVREPEPEPLTFKADQGLKLQDWNPAGETDNIELKKRSFAGSACLYIGCQSRGDDERRGAYRTTVLLSNGRYRMTAMVRHENIEALAGGDGGLRLMAGEASGAAQLGDAKWTDLSLEFDVKEFRRPIELRIELRARDGKAWLRSSSLLLYKL